MRYLAMRACQTETQSAKPGGRRSANRRISLNDHPGHEHRLAVGISRAGGAALLRLNDGNAIIEAMASITIRRLDDATKARLRVRAARHGRSMEAEVRDILQCAVAGQPRNPQNLADAIRARFAHLGGVELPEYPRQPPSEPPSFDE